MYTFSNMRNFKDNLLPHQDFDNTSSKVIRVAKQMMRFSTIGVLWVYSQIIFNMAEGVWIRKFIKRYFLYNIIRQTIDSFISQCISWFSFSKFS